MLLSWDGFKGEEIHAGFLQRMSRSGDGERKPLLTRQIVFEPLPASVLFAFLVHVFRSWRLNAVIPFVELRGSLIVCSLHYVCTEPDPNPQTLPLAVKLLH